MESNPRGVCAEAAAGCSHDRALIRCLSGQIPKAPFIEDVAGYVQESENAEAALKSLQELLASVYLVYLYIYALVF